MANTNSVALDGSEFVSVERAGFTQRLPITSMATYTNPDALTTASVTTVADTRAAVAVAAISHSTVATALHSARSVAYTGYFQALGVDFNAGVAETRVTWDYGNGPYIVTGASALGGTVAKQSGVTSVVGTGTTFTSDLDPGCVISIPGGGGTDTLVVTAITDDTHLTVATAPANTASGQTASTVATTVVDPTATANVVYQLHFSCKLTHVTAGTRTIALYAKNVLIPFSTRVYTLGATDDLYIDVTVLHRATAWDYFQVGITSSEATSPVSLMQLEMIPISTY